MAAVATRELTVDAATNTARVLSSDATITNELTSLSLSEPVVDGIPLKQERLFHSLIR